MKLKNEDKKGERLTFNVWPECGRLLGLSRASTYDAVARGDIPVIRIGKRLLVPRAALMRLLEQAGTQERRA